MDRRDVLFGNFLSHRTYDYVRDIFEFRVDPTHRVLFIQLRSYFSFVLSSRPFPPAMIGVMDICDILSWQFKTHRPCIDTEEALCRSVAGILIIFPTLPTPVNPCTRFRDEQLQGRTQITNNSNKIILSQFFLLQICFLNFYSKSSIFEPFELFEYFELF
jgi:hypothetical protein